MNVKQQRGKVYAKTLNLIKIENVELNLENLPRNKLFSDFEMFAEKRKDTNMNRENRNYECDAETQAASSGIQRSQTSVKASNTPVAANSELSV